MSESSVFKIPSWNRTQSEQTDYTVETAPGQQDPPSPGTSQRCDPRRSFIEGRQLPEKDASGNLAGARQSGDTLFSDFGVASRPSQESAPSRRGIPVQARTSSDNSLFSDFRAQSAAQEDEEDLEDMLERASRVVPRRETSSPWKKSSQYTGAGGGGTASTSTSHSEYRSTKTRPLGEAVPTGSEQCVVVASNSEIKVAAVRRLLDMEGSLSRGYTIETVKAPSHVNEQPFGHEETLTGALNRLEAAKAEVPGASFYVSIENGIFEVKIPDKLHKYFDLAWVVVETNDGRKVHAHSVGIEFPKTYVEAAAREGFEKTTVGSKMAAAIPQMDEKDPHRELSSGRFSRTGIIAQALAMACAQLNKSNAAEMS